MELHVLRLGDVAIATNDVRAVHRLRRPDEGPQSRRADLRHPTCTGSGGYLPTERAVRGGGYSAVIQSSRVGPEGGQVLVDRTVEAINALWPESK